MSWSFAFVADTHLIHGTPESAPHRRRADSSEQFYGSMIRAINAAGIDFVIHGGDIASGGHGFGDRQDVFEASMRRAKELESELGVPCFYACGNHDTSPEDGSKELYLRLFARGPEPFFAFSHGGLRIIVLDSQDRRAQTSTKFLSPPI